MKFKNLFSKTFLMTMVLFAMSATMFLGCTREAKAGDSSWTTTIDLGSSEESKAVVYSYRWYFRNDSLENHFTRGGIPVLAYCQKPVTVSITASGTVKNFVVKSYGTNIVSPGTLDTANLTILQGWDTAGLYTNKPVLKDTITVHSGGAFFGHLFFAIDGAAGNREDTWVQLDVAMLKED